MSTVAVVIAGETRGVALGAVVSATASNESNSDDASSDDRNSWRKSSTKVAVVDGPVVASRPAMVGATGAGDANLRRSALAASGLVKFDAEAKRLVKLGAWRRLESLAALAAIC